MPTTQNSASHIFQIWCTDLPGVFLAIVKLCLSPRQFDWDSNNETQLCGCHPSSQSLNAQTRITVRSAACILCICIHIQFRSTLLPTWNTMHNLEILPARAWFGFLYSYPQWNSCDFPFSTLRCMPFASCRASIEQVTHTLIHLHHNKVNGNTQG